MSLGDLRSTAGPTRPPCASVVGEALRGVAESLAWSSLSHVNANVFCGNFARAEMELAVGCDLRSKLRSTGRNFVRRGRTALAPSRSAPVARSDLEPVDP